MKIEFLQPKFDGARFNEHTLPLEVVRDLAAYEELVTELAKRLFLAEHPERQRALGQSLKPEFQLKFQLGGHWILNMLEFADELFRGGTARR